MTAEEIAVAAMARATEFTQGFPSTRSVMYRRIGQRQMELVSKATKLNPEYFGTCVMVDVPDGAADLKDLYPDFRMAENINKIEIAELGGGVIG